MEKRKNRIAWTAAIVFVLAAFAAAVLAVPSAYAEEAVFADSYALGDTVRIPARSIDAGGEIRPATSVVRLPDGTAISRDEITLSMPGKYTVEYRADNGGRTYKETHSFLAEYPAYAMAVQSDTATYGTAGDYGSFEGLVVNLSNGGEFTVNRIIAADELGQGNPLISLYVLPETQGSLDCRELYFRLEDALNPDNYMLIKVRQSQYADGVLYMSARAHNHPEFYGVEHGNPDGTPITGVHGYAAIGSFYGTGVGEDGYKISLMYDNDTQTVYAANSYYHTGETRYVIDLNNPKCFADGWSGFESGLIRLSVYAGSYDKASMRFIATEIAGCDLTSYVLSVTETSPISVDYGEYTAGDYPDAVVGRPYKIFPADSAEMYSSEKIEVNVYTAYGSSLRTNVDTLDGCFVPKSAVTHTIEYRCTDGFGNVRTLAVPVNVRGQSTPIAMEVDETPVRQEVGTDLTVPELSVLSGGEGNLSVAVALVNEADSAVTEVTGSSVRLMTVGDFSLRYTATDYNGQTKEKSISVTVTPSTGPVFPDDPLLPRTFIKDGVYAVPSLTAEDFSSGSAVTIPADVTITAGSSVLPVENDTFTASADGEIVLTYAATDAQGRTKTVAYSVPVKDTGLHGTLNIAAYFDAENGTVTANDRYLALTAAGQEARFSFVRETIGTAFEAVFNIAADTNEFGGVTFVLTDRDDAAVSVAFAIQKGADSSVLVTGGREIELDNAFGGSTQDFNVSLNGTVLTVANTTVAVTLTAGDGAFTGFPSGYAYCDIVLTDVAGAAEVQLRSFNRQPMTSVLTSDITEPRVMFSGSYGGEKNMGETAELCAVYAADVLDPYTEITFSVRAPSGGYVTATDGTLLQDVAADRIYDIVMEEYGRYRVNYSYTDGSGNTGSFSYVIPCFDKEPPAISLDRTELTGRVGRSVSLPGYTCTDNVSADDLIVTVQVIDPTGRISTVSGSFVPDIAGRYVIRYMAIDGNYNIAIAEAVCDVR